LFKTVKIGTNKDIRRFSYNNIQSQYYTHNHDLGNLFLKHENRLKYVQMSVVGNPSVCYYIKETHFVFIIRSNNRII